MKTKRNHTLTVFFAYWLRASPCCLKIRTLAFSKSFLSIPSRRGIAPTRMATSTSLKATSTFDVDTTSTDSSSISTSETNADGIQLKASVSHFNPRHWSYKRNSLKIRKKVCGTQNTNRIVSRSIHHCENVIIWSWRVGQIATTKSLHLVLRQVNSCIILNATFFLHNMVTQKEKVILKLVPMIVQTVPEYFRE